MKRATILDTAKRLITGDREQEHGSPRETFTRIADLWSGYLGYTVSPADVAVMMGLLKAARLRKNPGSGDGWVDACGYFALGGELADAQTEPLKAPAMGIDPKTGRVTYTNADPDPDPNWQLHPDYRNPSDG